MARRMAHQREAGVDARPRLSRDRVLRAAVGLADERGIETLSMRRLAEALGVEAMSLYYHVANKDDILGAMVDIAVGEIETPATPAGWKADIRRGAISFHETMRRHPWARALLASPSGLRPERLRFMEWLLGRLRDGGFTAGLTYHAYHAIDSHLIGSTAWEASYLAFSRNRELADVAQGVIEQLSPETHPYVVEHIQQHVAGFGRGKSQFQFGLDLILDSLERMRDAAGPAPPGSS